MTTECIILTVTQLNHRIRHWLENDAGEVCVQGEISNISKPASGHFYFTIKDATAQLRCVYFRNRHPLSNPVSLQNGLEIIAQGQLSLYEARGDFQLIVDHIQEAGLGNLYRQFELLKAKLAALGLFDASRKKILPRFPACIGIITSSTGAALRDILITLARRYPLASVLIYPSEVQGAQAHLQLIDAIKRANHDAQCDVLLLARGGGSIEDLWAFNHEQLAYAIANSLIPIVSGVGHETDFTIADFVADCRAATPTAAAETVTPDQLELMAYLQHAQSRLIFSIQGLLKQQTILLDHAMQRMSSPQKLIATHWQTLDYLTHRLHRAIALILTKKIHQLSLVNSHLKLHNPSLRIQQYLTESSDLEKKLLQLMAFKLQQAQQQFSTLLATLQAVSPLATLERGYAIATFNNQVIYRQTQVQCGDRINIQLHQGSLLCNIIEKKKEQ